MIKTFRTFFLALIAGLFLTAGTIEIAQADGTADIKARKATMKAIGGHMGGIKLALKGKGGSGALVAHAEGMAAMGRAAGGYFPKGSEMGKIKTRALPAIWAKPAEFKTAVDAFTSASAALLTAAKGGDKGAIGKAMKGLGKSCGGCHKNFRAKKKKKKKKM
jgi:cytochrome c556